ncbi:conserved hypothetical protein [Trichinella spiralis]|uniref:hypothetical protein n=1 Tax=Trichinella spiralis TaxID=6334 RepID=UPI0001EFCBF5|nr:conserved hypothetical protein [Trichinella spiralis]
MNNYVAFLFFQTSKCSTNSAKAAKLVEYLTFFLKEFQLSTGGRINNIHFNPLYAGILVANMLLTFTVVPPPSIASFICSEYCDSLS